MKTTLCTASMGCLGSASPSLPAWAAGSRQLVSPLVSTRLWHRVPATSVLRQVPSTFLRRQDPASPAHRDEVSVGLGRVLAPCLPTTFSHPTFSRRRRGKRRPAFHFSFRKRPTCQTSAPYIIPSEACSWLLARHNGGYRLRFINVLQAQLLWAPSAPSISRGCAERLYISLHSSTLANEFPIS